MADEETIGERIKRLRTEKKLSVQDLAFKVGIGENALRKLESGENKSPSLMTGVRLAQQLGVGAAYLAIGKDSPASRVSPLVVAEPGTKSPRARDPWAEIAAAQQAQLDELRKELQQHRDRLAALESIQLRKATDNA